MYVKLEEAKKHLLLDDSFKDDDLYILGLIDVAEDAVARNLNLKLDELAVDEIYPTCCYSRYSAADW